MEYTNSTSVIYEDNYNKYILPKYGSPRNVEYDLDLITSNNLEINDVYHTKTNNIRKKYHDLDIITIDPPNCTDADDAFSIYEKDNKIFLAIHIADPTHYININSNLWHNILKRILTHYPSNNKPIHMMPEEIVQKSSLMETSAYSSIKNAISITFEINKDTYLPTNNIKLEFTEIIVKNEHKYTYNEASKLPNKEEFIIGIKISQNLKSERSKKTTGTKLSDINILSYPFLNVTPEEKLMKEMIGEFAILTNSYIGEFMKLNMGGLGIFRTCSAEFSRSILTEISGEELLNKIITEGISAEYTTEQKSHDLVGNSIYTHFTSPMRRASDCICHILIKSYLCNINYPWTLDELTLISNRCYQITKKEKSRQYDDQKFRMIQHISNLILTNDVHIKFKITGYTGLFLNCLISNLLIKNSDSELEHRINISYTLRNSNFNYCHQPDNNYIIKINSVNPIEQFDEGSIPDLDNYIYSLFS